MEVNGPSLDALRDILAAASQGESRSLERLRTATRNSPNPSKPEHVVALREWLNAWTCRIPYPRAATTCSLHRSTCWWRKHRRRLIDVPLVDLDDRGLEAYADAYADLVDLPAGVNNLGRIRSLAPTASSKLLWVLRSQTACPWDVAIAKAGGRGTQRDGYAHHLHKARTWARVITAEATTRGIDDISTHLGRPASSVVRIYDEWCYLAFTRGLP